MEIDKVHTLNHAKNVYLGVLKKVLLFLHRITTYINLFLTKLPCTLVFLEFLKTVVSIQYQSYYN